jgi:hypothetical protein
MGQDFSNFCSCFDKIQESKQEMMFVSGINDVPKPADIQKGEIDGFDYEEVVCLVNQAVTSFTELVDEGVQGYDVIYDKENCKVYSKEAPDGYILKYTWTLPCSPKDFMAFMDRIDLRKTWDSNIDLVQVLGEYSDKESIIYTKYKKFLTFDPRETLTYTRSMHIHGNLAGVTFSVESEKFPITNGAVRVKLFVAGLYAEEIPMDEMGNTTKVTCISHMDVGLPKALNNVARKFAGTTIPPLTKKICTQLKKHQEALVSELKD